MRPEGHSDWRDAAAYAPLLEADRSILAWEWLRRDPAYRQAAGRWLRRPASRGACEAAAAWGLHAFEPPHRPAPLARPVWRTDVHAHVLAAMAVGAGPGPDAFDLSRLEAMSTLVRTQGRERLLISDGLRAIRLDILSGSLAAGPVRLRYLLSGLDTAEKPLLTLRRLLALWRRGRFSAMLHPREPRAARWVLMLRAFDALGAGADQREIAEALLSDAAAGARWRTASPSLRSRVQRLVRGARRMAAGGYLRLLG
ncbi:MAG: DUF2285 domain-containing protein [Sphingomonas sp.]|nr:DUF2285 domain-containing protein [Sphingomonas sp.]